MKRSTVSSLPASLVFAALAIGIAAVPVQSRADENVFVFTAPTLDICDTAHPALSVTVRNTSPLATTAMATSPMSLTVREGALSGRLAMPLIAPNAMQTLTIALAGQPSTNDSLTTISVLGAQNGMTNAILEVAGLAFQRKICPSLGRAPAATTATK
jgi:hypothetical protein